MNRRNRASWIAFSISTGAAAAAAAFVDEIAMKPRPGRSPDFAPVDDESTCSPRHYPTAW